MRIGCLQFAPVLGDVDNNLNRADSVLCKANPKDLDLLVLPEMAFSGYNFKSLQEITPFLEPTTAGITSLWARTTALKYDCVVVAGYPEKVDVTDKWPASPEYYNSAITVNGDGETIANYRKSFLYYTDETWALEGPDGFYDGEIEGLGYTAMGICKWQTNSFERMDLNPYKFETPWSTWEFAYHILHKQANLVIISMAWITREDARSYSRQPKNPDMETLSYWLARLEPVIRAEDSGEIVVVLANRTGIEGDCVYAGTSTVLGIEAGEVKVYGILGRGEKELLVVDTSVPPMVKLVSEPQTLSVPTTSRPEPNLLSDGFTRDGRRPNPSATAKPSQERHRRLSISSTRAQNGYDDDEDRSTSIGSILASGSLSPVEIVTNHAYHSEAPTKTEEVVQLKSTIRSKYSRTPSPSPSISPSFDPVSHQPTPRPASPKSRNASRTRPIYQEPALVLHDLANEPKLISLAHSQRDSTHSASQVLDKKSVEHNLTYLGHNSKDGSHTFPRPKSTVW